MNTRHDSPDGPEDIDAAFAEIVAGLRRDTPMSSWPEEPKADEPAAGSATVQDGEEGPRDWTPPVEDEGHFEPPEPPPLPKPRLNTMLGLLGIVAGLILLLVPGLTGQGGPIALPLGLVLISAGIAWLLFRMRQGPPGPDDGDDGARL
jgi:hypothetical protein